MDVSIYEANKTMRIVGKQYAISFDSKEGQAVIDILNAMQLEPTTDNIMLACHAMQYGLYQGRREGRKQANKRSVS